MIKQNFGKEVILKSLKDNGATFMTEEDFPTFWENFLAGKTDVHLVDRNEEFTRLQTPSCTNKIGNLMYDSKDIEIHRNGIIIKNPNEILKEALKGSTPISWNNGTTTVMIDFRQLVNLCYEEEVPQLKYFGII